MAGLLLCLSLTLLTILDIRRGFLFTDYSTRSSFYVLHGLHVPLLGVGVLGILICLTRLRTLERRLPATGLDRWLPYAIAAVLLADLIAYRAVPAARSLAAGGINVAGSVPSSGGNQIAPSVSCVARYAIAARIS